jgi:hypothetical protein
VFAEHRTPIVVKDNIVAALVTEEEGRVKEATGERSKGSNAVGKRERREVRPIRDQWIGDIPK